MAPTGHAKQGFHWKSIEEKPSNWEVVRALITDAYAPKEFVRDRFWDHPLVYKIFLETFPELNEWLKLDAEETNTKKKGRGGNKKPPSRKDDIQRRVEEDLIRKEIQKIKIDPKLWQPVKSQFDMQVSFFLLILLWNFVIRQKKPKNVSKLTYLDALISFNRLYDYDIQYITRKDVRDCLVAVHSLLNRSLDTSFYDVLFEHPILLVQCTAQRRDHMTKLYPEQKLILEQLAQAVKDNTPLLLGNQMPTGTGKTFLAVPLAKKMSSLKLKKTVLFTCSNELVNKDVASTAIIADDLHVWLAKLILQDGLSAPTVLLRPYKRCFPATWKKVYKTNVSEKIGSIQDQWNFYVRATGKNPDIIVADLEASRELLKEAQTIQDPFVLYLDEFLSDAQSNIIVADMCRFLPKQSVLLSSILPQFEQLPTIVRSFCDRFSCTADACVKRVATADVNIACAVIDQDGYLRMPHHLAHDINDVQKLCNEILVNPRIRRAYPARHVYNWAQSVDDIIAPHGLSFSSTFSDIGKITASKVIDYAIQLLNFLYDHPEHLEIFQSYRPQIMPAPNKDELFTRQSWVYDGKTLFISDDPFRNVYSMSDPLFDSDVCYANIADKNRWKATKQKEEMDRLAEKVKASHHEKNIMMSEIMESYTATRLPDQYVINSRAHYERFHTGGDGSSRPVVYRSANDLPSTFDYEFDDRTNLLMASGAMVFEKRRMTAEQRNMAMSMYDRMSFLCSGHDIVFGTNLPGLTNIFIDTSFAHGQSMSTLYQLMGRVGRMGRSYHANIILNNEATVQKILSLETNIDAQEGCAFDQLFTSFL